MKKTHQLLFEPDGSLSQPSAENQAPVSLPMLLRPERWVWINAVIVAITIIVIICIPIAKLSSMAGLKPLVLIALLTQALRLIFEWQQFTATANSTRRNMESRKVSMGLTILSLVVVAGATQWRLWAFDPITTARIEVGIVFEKPLPRDSVRIGHGTNGCWIIRIPRLNHIAGSFTASRPPELIYSDFTRPDYFPGYVHVVKFYFDANHWTSDNRLQSISSRNFFEANDYLQLMVSIPDGTKYRSHVRVSLNGKPPTEIDNNTFVLHSEGPLIRVPISTAARREDGQID